VTKKKKKNTEMHVSMEDVWSQRKGHYGHLGIFKYQNLRKLEINLFGAEE